MLGPDRVDGGDETHDQFGYYCWYLQVWLERRHSIGRHRPRKAVGVDDALSQGRENACLTQKRFLSFPSSLGVSHLPGKLNPGHHAFISRAYDVPRSYCISSSTCEKQLLQLSTYVVVEHCSRSLAGPWPPPQEKFTIHTHESVVIGTPYRAEQTNVCSIEGQILTRVVMFTPLFGTCTSSATSQSEALTRNIY